MRAASPLADSLGHAAHHRGDKVRRLGPRILLLILVLCALVGLPALGKPPDPRERAARGRGGALAFDWLDPTWTYRVKVTVVADRIEGNGNLLDFPLLLHLDGAVPWLFEHARSDGCDLVVTKADGKTVLGREIVTWDAASRDAEVWFRADTLSKSIRSFYVYYGNPDTCITAAPAWPASYLGVYHFAGDPGAGIVGDSGPSDNDAAAGLNAGFASADTIAGAIGRGWRFNGTTNWIDGDAIQSADSSFTISAWFACWNQMQDANFAFSVQQGFWHLSAKRNSSQRVPDFVQNGFFSWGPNPLPDTLLHNYVWAMDGVADTIRFFYDGVEQPPLVRFKNPITAKVYTGLQIEGNVGIASPLFGNSNPFDLMEGIVDEFRVMRGIRGPQRVATEFRNQKNPAGFYLWGAPEMQADTTAVFLQSFTAEAEEQRVIVRWIVAGVAADLAGFHIFSGPDRAHVTRLNDAFVPAVRWGPYGSREYEFVDARPPDAGRLYWLAEVLSSGDVIWHGPAAVEGVHLGARVFLAQNQPNPFGGSTRIGFRLATGERVRLVVFDPMGRKVAELLQRPMDPGAHEVAWNGCDARGRRVPAGVYFYRLETTTAAFTRKLVVSR